MSTAQHDVDILVVGAGPVGLTLAYELQRHGLSCRIIDQKLAPSETSRALGVFNRTLEVFEMMGIAEDIALKTQPVHFLNAYARGRHLMQVSFESRDLETPFAYPVFCAQTHVEEVLRSRLAEKGIPVEWGMALENLVQDEHSVTINIRDQDGSMQSIRSLWLAGCDGGHSRVRKLLHLPFDGNADETWLVADVNLDWSLPKDSVYAFFSSYGTVMAYPFPEGKRWRLLNTVVDEQRDPTHVAQRFTDAITSVYREEPVQVPEPLWLSFFTIQQRHVPDMRVQRCFVVGDAAHVHSPASGQGMNTGIQDAFNLAWKLALVTHGQMDDMLLNSYSAEREPIARTVLRGAGVFTRAIGSPPEALKQARNLLLKGVFTLPVLRHQLNRLVTGVLSGLKLGYDHSPLITEDWQVTGINARHMSGFSVGARIPDIHYSFDGRARLYDLLRGTEHVALLFAGMTAQSEQLAHIIPLARSIREHYGSWLRVYVFVPGADLYTEAQAALPDGEIVLDQYSILHRRFGSERGALYLVRPDGYLGYRNQPASLAQFERYVHQTLHVHEMATV